MKNPIETHELTKHYRQVTAVDHLSLQVAEGEIYGFLGLNGAGKTTTIRMLLGMIKPDSGSAVVLGKEIHPGSREPWASVGYLVETPSAYAELTVIENLEIARRMHPGVAREAVSEAIERLNLSAYAYNRAGTLSLGNAQRLGLAKALLHTPALLLLDEPANGLDPVGIVEIRELLLELTRERGVTVFMSSHILAEVSRLAQRIGIIHQGRLLQELDASDMEKNRRRRLLIKAQDSGAAHAALVSAGYPAVLKDNGTVVLSDGPSVENPDLIAAFLVGAGNPPTRLIVDEEDLEQYFLRLIGLNEGRAS